MKSRYPEAATALKRWLDDRHATPGTRISSAKKLGQDLGFTTAVMQRACQALIARGTLERRGYKLLVRGSGSLALALDAPVLVVSYLENFSRSAKQLLTSLGVPHRIVQLSHLRDPRLEPSLRRALQTAPSGLLICTAILGEGAAAMLREAAFPVVACVNYVTPDWTHSVGQTDTYRGVESALRHLQELGHQRIAHFAVLINETDQMLLECYHSACLSLGLPQAAKSIWRSKLVSPEGVRASLRESLRAHPEVTALCTGDRGAEVVRHLIKVPNKLSLINLGNLDDSVRQSITSLEPLDVDASAVWACAELLARLQRQQAGLPARRPVRAFFEPEFKLRASTSAVARRKPATRQQPTRMAADSSNPGATWQALYPSLQRRRSRNWNQLDLAGLANHSLSKHHGWLGAEPLEHFPPGLREIHGAPFRVIDEATNQGRAVVTFLSARTRSAGGKELPTRVQIAVGAKIEALYFLHGCGSAKPVCFAHYDMHHRSGATSSVPLIALGLSRRDAVPDLQPNVQDWWPGNKHENFPHAHFATVFDPADPPAYERTIYSLEWINPRLWDEVEFIEVKVDPEAGPTLALLAATALMPESVPD